MCSGGSDYAVRSVRSMQPIMCIIILMHAVYATSIILIDISEMTMTRYRSRCGSFA
jgi:hypothetical protein